MRLSKVEFSVYTVAAVIICVFSTLFYLDFTSKAAVGQERVVGSITYKKRVAQRKFAEQVVWEDIERREPVYNNDSIRTADGSETVIRLVDGTEIMVNENSMILLSMATNEIDIQFRGGSISAKRGDVESNDITKLNIKSGETTVSVDKSDVQVSGEKDKGINLTVDRGEAKVVSGNTEKRVEENQKVVVARDAKTIDVVSIPLKPREPRPDSVIATQGATAAITFAWETLRPEQDASLQITGPGEGEGRTIARKITGSSAVVGLAPGSYSWRITARNRNTGGSEESGSRRLTILREMPARLMSPGNGEVFRYAGENPIVAFKWSGSENTQSYQLNIASDPGMKSVVRTVTTADSQIAVDTLGTGTYYWQVVSVIRVGESTSSSTSPARSFAVSKQAVINPPRPLFPSDGSTVRRAVIINKGVLFSWQKNGEIPQSTITIAKDPGLTNVIFKGSSSVNFISLRKELEPGTYYWGLHGQLPGGKLTGPSASLRFTVSDNDSIRLIAPAEASELTLMGAAGLVRFTWEQSDLYGEYVLQVSRSKTFAGVAREERVQGGSAVLAGLTGGTYYWRVLLKNTDGGTIMKSGTNYLVIRELLDLPTITSPRNGEVIDFERLQGVDLTWKIPADANRFRLRFYRIEKSAPRLVAERNLNASAMEIKDMNFLGEGKFMFSVQALKMDGDGTKVLRESPVARSYFEVRADKAEQKPRIILPKVIYLEE
jgi:hypothetical protein